MGFTQTVDVLILFFLFFGDYLQGSLCVLWQWKWTDLDPTVCDPTTVLSPSARDRTSTGKRAVERPPREKIGEEHIEIPSIVITVPSLEPASRDDKAGLPTLLGVSDKCRTYFTNFSKISKTGPKPYLKLPIEIPSKSEWYGALLKAKIYGTRLYWLEPKAVKFSRKPQPTLNQALDLCQSDLPAWSLATLELQLLQL